MQEAGRILLMPKGDYSASATYEMLDLVNHSGASWVCKKDCTGQEPSDSNTEFWQRFGTAVDMSNYLSKSGGAINGNIKVYTLDDTYRVFTLENGTRTLEFALYAGGAFRIYDITNNKVILLSTVDGTNTIDATASGNLPLTGGKVSGANVNPIIINSTSSEDMVRIPFQKSGATRGFLGFVGTKPAFTDASYNYYELFHTGNKPTGTYTGNGDATERTINTGGIGNMCLIYAGSYAVIATPNGAFRTNGVDFNGMPSANCKFVNGVLTIADASAYVNTNGWTYSYQVL